MCAREGGWGRVAHAFDGAEARRLAANSGRGMEEGSAGGGGQGAGRTGRGWGYC